MKNPRVPCNYCGRKVRDCFESKWQHVLKYHPHVPMFQLMNLFLNPVASELFGAWIGRKLRSALKGVES